MTARPHLRRGRLAHLPQLDHQRPRPRLERMPPPRRDRWDAPVAALALAVLAFGVVTAIVVRGCS